MGLCKFTISVVDHVVNREQPIGTAIQLRNGTARADQAIDPAAFYASARYPSDMG